ncbi:MAG: archaellin/type IV pilin N-terminal domain-containing protein [Candidatus Bathyarchaeia archaeon]
MAKKPSESKKAISPILATLLLIVIAVAAIVVTYAWVMTYMTNTSTQAGIMLKKDAISWPDNNTITIYVRNVGTADATINAVYIGTSSTNMTLLSNVTYNPANGLVEKNGGTLTINVTLTWQWTPKTTYYFRIVPKVGEALVFQETAP